MMSQFLTGSSEVASAHVQLNVAKNVVSCPPILCRCYNCTLHSLNSKCFKDIDDKMSIQRDKST